MNAVETVETEPAAISVRVSRLGEVQDRIDKANRRLTRAGIAERFSLTVGEVTRVEHVDQDTRRKVSTDMVEVALNTPSLGYNGWTFVATLSFEEHGTVVRSVPGQVCSYRPDSKVCDQCHTARERRETFVVRSADGEYRQVGRNCLALFFGLKPSLWVFELELSDLDERDADAGTRSSWDSQEAVAEIVAAALAVTNGGLGYVSKASAEVTGHDSTSSQTFAALYERVSGNNRYAEERRAQLAEWRTAALGHLADGTVEKVVAAAAAIEGDSEYAQNIRILAQGEFADRKNIGFVASFVSVYARALKLAAERQVRAARVNEYIGSVGDKKVVTVGTVTNLREIEGQYGTSTLIEWTTADGLVAKWFASNAPALDLGDAVTVTGTVKKHEEYRGTKSTMFTRCSVKVAVAA